MNFNPKELIIGTDRYASNRGDEYRIQVNNVVAGKIIVKQLEHRLKIEKIDVRSDNYAASLPWLDDALNAYAEFMEKEYENELAKEAAFPHNPKTASGWELFSDKPGAAGVAKKMNAGLEKAKKELDKELKEVRYFNEEKVSVIVNRVYKKTLYAVMEKYSDFGACDTEPRYHAEQAIIDHVKQVYDIPRDDTLSIF
jgi:hypothetical protein